MKDLYYNRWTFGEEYIRIPLEIARLTLNFRVSPNYPEKYVELITIHGIKFHPFIENWDYIKMTREEFQYRSNRDLKEWNLNKQVYLISKNKSNLS